MMSIEYWNLIAYYRVQRKIQLETV